MRPQLFEPWAVDLLRAAGVRSGQKVLDVASGTGVVAHLAAEVVGADGTVTATDISAPMLAVSAARERPPGTAPIQFIRCSATALDLADHSFDVALCQQGLPFIQDRAAALAEMRRALVTGGVAAVSVWDAGHPHGLFTLLFETLAEAELPEPYPGAYDGSTYNMSGKQVHDAFDSAGFEEIRVEMRTLTAEWPDLDSAIATVQGTPFGPSVAALPAADRDRILRSFAKRLSASSTATGRIRCETHAQVGLGIA
jgi:ubiquinone/menaquinone biosynthesis C-methylase UbiE